MSYVNIYGKPVCPAQLARLQAKPKQARDTLKRTDDRTLAKVSEGFLVTGYSPEQLDQGKRDHAIAIDLANDHNAREPAKPVRVPGPWDEEAFMRMAKPKRVRTKPYSIKSAAEQCAELATKAGWKGVRVEEVLKA